MAVQCPIFSSTEHNFTYFCPLNFSSFFLDAGNVVEALSFAVWYFSTFCFYFFEYYIIGSICRSLNYLSYNLHDAFRNIWSKKFPLRFWKSYTQHFLIFILAFCLLKLKFEALRSQKIFQWCLPNTIKEGAENDLCWHIESLGLLFDDCCQIVNIISPILRSNWLKYFCSSIFNVRFSSLCAFVLFLGGIGRCYNIQSKFIHKHLNICWNRSKGLVSLVIVK